MENGVGRARGRGRGMEPVPAVLPPKPLRKPKFLVGSEDQFSDTSSNNEDIERNSSLGVKDLKIIQSLAERTKNMSLDPSVLPEPETVLPKKKIESPPVLPAEPKLNVNASPFVPRLERRISTFSDSSDRCPSREGVATPGLELFSAEDDYHPLVNYLTEVLTCVTLYPGRFERQASKLVNVLNKRVIPDEEVLGTIVETIYSQSVIEPNFRYNGARLCSVLCEKLDATFGKTTFRTLLLQRLQTDHKRRLELLKYEPVTLQGFALFLCEVYLNVEIVIAGKPKARFLALQKPIHETLMVLISGNDNDNLRCVCKCLKLAGTALEDDERISNNGLSVHMNSLMETLKRTAAVAKDVSKDVLLMIVNVIELRASDWGRSPSSPVMQSNPLLYQNRTLTPHTTYYNGGHAFDSNDHFYPYETDFYGEAGDQFEDELDFTFSSDEEFDGGMDPEMEKAFEEFLNET